MDDVPGESQLFFVIIFRGAAAAEIPNGEEISVFFSVDGRLQASLRKLLDREWRSKDIKRTSVLRVSANRAILQKE
jgi:hypothetical protein